MKVWRDGEAPDVDDVPHVQGAELQGDEDVVGQGGLMAYDL